MKALVIFALIAMGLLTTIVCLDGKPIPPSMELRQTLALERIATALENNKAEAAGARENLSKETTDAIDRLKVLESRVGIVEANQLIIER